MKFFNHYKTIVISDIPLGASPEYFKKLIYFIKNTSCDKLILSGDLIKGWQSKRIEKLYKLHNKFLKTLLKVAERDNTEIIFVTGNEWNYKDNFDSCKLFNFSFVRECKFTSGGNTYYVISDDLSTVLKNRTFTLFPLNKLSYNFLLWLNKKINTYRIHHGKKYFSLLKRFNKFIDKDIVTDYSIAEYKLGLVNLAVKKECEGIICGHPAYSGIYHFGGVTFLSSGYWTETLTALAESNYGKWEVVDFEKIVRDKMEARLHADIIEELFEQEKNMIFITPENLTKG